MTYRTPVSLVLLAVIGLASGAHAEEDAPGPGAPMQLSFEPSMPVLDAMQRVAERLNLQFAWHGSDKGLRQSVDGGPTLRGTPEQILSDFRTLLMGMEIVLLPVGERNPAMKRTFFAQDVKAGGVIRPLRPEPIELDEHNLDQYKGEPWRYVTTTIQLEHLRDLRHMRTAVAKLVTGSAIGQITEVPDANALVVTDFAPSVVAIYRLARRMDVPDDGPSSAPRIVVIKLEHADAREMARLADRLIVRPAKDAPPSRPVSLRVVADARTNQVVVSGRAEPVAQMEAMIRQLDVAKLRKATLAPPAKPVVRVVGLKSVSAGEAQHALTQFVNASSNLFDVRPSILAVSSRNALLITGTEQAHKVLNSLIASLDHATEK